MEIELPIVNLNRAPVDFSLVHEMTEHFVETRGFSEISLDDDGYIYQAKHPETGDTLSFDCSYNTLEFSFCKEMTGKSPEPFVHAYAKSKALIPEGIRLDFYHNSGIGLQKGFGEDFVKKGLIYVTERTKNEMLLAELESCDGMYIQGLEIWNISE